MAEFTYPPLTPDPDPAPLSPDVDLNPPMVGTASPFVHVDGQNRDLILESIRAWIRTRLLPWTTAWQNYLEYWLALVATWLNLFVTEADAYITEHAIAGYSFRTTATPIASSGTTDVVLVVDTVDRPLAINDLVLDESTDGNYGIITALIDATHATVTYVGSLRGPQGVQGIPGYSLRTTATTIAGTGTTDVVLAVDAVRPFVVNDLVLDQSSDGNYGIITALIDATHATVTYVGSLRGPQGVPGVVQSIVAGANVTVDSSDPANPVVSASGGGGGGSTVYPTQTALFAASTTVGDTYTVANAPGLFWTPLGGTVWAIEGVLQVDTSDDTSSLFDTDFYTDYFDGSGRVLYVFHRYSGITYRWTDSNSSPGLPWDSDWIYSPPVSTIPEMGAGTISGMLKFSAGSVKYRGEVVLGSATDLGSPLRFSLPPGLVTNYTGDLPVQPSKIGDCWLNDGTSTWRGVVVADLSGPPFDQYALFVPDLAGSTNFGSDIWAGDVTSTVNHTWASGASLGWELDMPLDSFGTSYDDGRTTPGGDFPVGGGALGPGGPSGPGRGLIYPSQNEPTETQTNPLPTQAGVSGWDFVFGGPIPPGIDTLGGSGVQGVGASFSGSGIQGGYVGEYTPVMDQPVSFTGLAGAGISGLTDDQVYYINGIVGGYFTVSTTVGGSTAAFTGTGTCDTFTLHNLPPGTVVHKNSQYEYVEAIPVLSSGYTTFNVQQQQYWNWLLYAF